MRPRPRAVTCAIALSLAAALAPLAGCEDNLTMDNYNTITQGMTLSEVETILGGAGEDQTTGGVGIGATGLEGQEATEAVYIWTEGDRQVIVTFRDAKVHNKRQIGLE